MSRYTAVTPDDLATMLATIGVDTIDQLFAGIPAGVRLGRAFDLPDGLGEVVFFEPPAVGATVTKDEPYTEIESVKAVSDVIAPLSGEIVAINDALSGSPETINEDPYGEGWLVEVRLSDPSEAESLLSPADYQATLA